MARPSKYIIEGYIYHLTQRCHDRQFLMQFGRDRSKYREWLRVGVKRHGVSVYGFSITSNHVHVIVRADDVEAVSNLMHLASGSTAKQYNLRKKHLGSVWQHPYDCTMIEHGQHLLNCLCYVDTNMVRAGKVSHPSEWRWCGYDELVGQRRRYRIIDIERLARDMDMETASDFYAFYSEAVERRLELGRNKRESQWTESLAVGSRQFVDDVSVKYHRRMSLDVAQGSGHNSLGTWTVREQPAPYGAI